MTIKCIREDCANGSPFSCSYPHISPTVYVTKSNTLPPCEPRTEVINTDVHLVWNLPIPYFETPISIPDFNTGTLPKMIP